MPVPAAAPSRAGSRHRRRVRLHDTWNRALKVFVARPGAELKVHWLGLDRPGPVSLQNLQNSTGNGNGVSNLQCCSASREASRSRPAAAAVISLGLSAHLFRHQQRWMGDASDLLCSSQPQIPYHQHIGITDISSFYCTLRPRPCHRQSLAFVYCLVYLHTPHASSRPRPSVTGRPRPLFRTNPCSASCSPALKVLSSASLNARFLRTRPDESIRQIFCCRHHIVRLRK